MALAQTLTHILAVDSALAGLDDLNITMVIGLTKGMTEDEMVE